MFRIFLKQDAIYNMRPNNLEKKSAINQFHSSSIKVIQVFKKLLKEVYPHPLSDYQIRHEFQKNRIDNKKKTRDRSMGSLFGGSNSLGKSMSMIRQSTIKRLQRRKSQSGDKGDNNTIKAF